MILPLDMDYGAHTVTAKFFGGFTWVDPMGQGDSLNPEYYLPAASTVEFNVTQTSQVVITTPPERSIKTSYFSLKECLQMEQVVHLEIDI